MSQTETSVEVTQEAPPVDPGCLPAWNVGDLPAPAPFRLRNLVGLIGPGLVLAGSSIGSGEYVLGPQMAARYHGALMWAALISILAQVVLNTEVMRYTILTGEPIFTGFLRTWPGPKFWLVVYLLFDFGGWWPTQAGLAAQILVVMMQGLMPGDTIDPETVRRVSYGVFAVCAAASLFGGKIYNTVSLVASGKFLFTLFFMLLVCIFFVSAKTWFDILGGMINPWNLPRDAAGNAHIDWAIVAALVAFSGVGGLNNILVSNFVREKGWGMGGQVGAIASAFGGHRIKLSHIGTMCRPTPTALERFRGWWKYLVTDQYLIWALGSIIGILLPCMIGAEYLRVDAVNSNETWRWAAALAQDFGAREGWIFRIIMLLCGLIIMVPGQFLTIDSTARKWTDAVWSGSRLAREVDVHKAKYVYYSFAGAFIFLGMAGYTFFPWLSASTMMVVAGNCAVLALSASIFHTLYVNHRFLPKAFRPSLLKSALLAAAGLFFLGIFGLMFQQKILPALLK